MENLSLELLKVTSRAIDVKTFRFRLDKETFFKPGQYLILTLKAKGQNVSKAFSISNSPTEKNIIEFTKKISSSDFSKALTQLSVEDRVLLRFPLGNFTFEGEYPKAVFLSGGIGITPIRSIFKYATDKQLSSRLVLLYSSRTPDYLIFRDDFNEMQRTNKNLKIVYTLTDCPEHVEGCRSGYIDEEMVHQEIPDFSECVFYICGPPGMVAAMSSMLLNKLSIPQAKIITENFVGY